MQIREATNATSFKSDPLFWLDLNICLLNKTQGIIVIILYTIIIQLHTMPGILLKYGFRMKETSISFEKQELIIFYLPPGAVIAIVKALWTWDFSWILGKSCVYLIWKKKEIVFSSIFILDTFTKFFHLFLLQSTLGHIWKKM